MRPRGDVRRALVAAAPDLVREMPWGFTCRQLATVSQVGYGAARWAVQDMVRTGELDVVGVTRVPGVCRPANLYAPARPELANDSVEALARVMSAWAGGEGGRG